MASAASAASSAAAFSGGHVAMILSVRHCVCGSLGYLSDVQGFPLNPPAPDRELRASIMAGGRVWSFNISGSGDNHEFLRASLLETSPPLTRKLNAWWYAGF